MPLYMKDALEVVPPSKDGIHEDHKQNYRRKNRDLAPNDRFVLNKLYSNYTSLAQTPLQKLINQVKIQKPSSDNLSPTYRGNYWEAERRGRVEDLMPFQNKLSPLRPMSKTIASVNTSDKLSKLINSDKSKHLRIQAPLSTVIVRWHNSRYYGGYPIRQIFDILRVFGRIESLCIVSERSARATFTRLDNACSAVSTRFLGNPSNPMLCDWFHKTMLNKTFTVKRRHLHVAHDPFIGY
ncbi:uncharacterized protein [Antedon mediterranea]|uniref:uncharacterized protein n=1 Tax=Antedon mediterranea TaxID=105859 RepID=UPI003AF7FE6F